MNLRSSRLAAAFIASLIVILVLSSRALAQGPEPTPFTCPGAPAPRLLAGAQGRVTPGDANNVRDQPTTGGVLVGQIPGGDSFTVLEGPVCADDFVWWRVEYGSMVGWTVEGSGGDYWLEPFTPGLAAPADCPGAPPSRLAAGQWTRSIGLYSLNPRTEPGGEEILEEPYWDELLLVEGGPRCLEEVLWWQISYSAGSAWVPETFFDGGSTLYLLDVPQTPPPTPVPTVTPQPGVNPLLPPVPISLPPPAENAITSTSADQVVEVARLGKGRITGMIWSPTGSSLLVSGSLGIWVYNAQDVNAPPRLLDAHAGVVSQVTFSSDGTLLASASLDGTVRLWDGSTLEEIAVIPHDGPVNAVGFSPNGHLLALGMTAESEGLLLWDITDPANPVPAAALASEGEVTRLTFIPDGTRLLTEGNAGLLIWDVTSREIIANPVSAEMPDDLESWSLTADGTRVVIYKSEMIGGGEPEGSFSMAYFYYVFVCDTTTGEQIEGAAELSVMGDYGYEAQQPPYLVYFDPSGRYILSVTGGNVRVHTSTGRYSGFSYYTGEDLLPPAAEGVQTIGFNGDGSLVAMGGEDGGIRLYEPIPDDHSLHSINALYGISGQVIQLIFSPDGMRIAATGSDGTVRLWDVSSGQRLVTWPDHNRMPGDLTASPDGRLTAETKYGGSIVIREAATGEVMNRLSLEPDTVLYPLAFSPDGSSLASYHSENGEDGQSYELLLWTLSSEENRLLTASSERIEAALFNPDGTVLAFSTEETVYFVSTETGEIIRELVGFHATPRKMAFSPDGRLLAAYDSGIYTVENTASVRVWNVADGSLLAEFPVGIPLPVNLEFSADGTRLVITEEIREDLIGGIIHVIDLEAQAEAITIHAEGRIHAVALSRDGSLVAAAVDDGSIHLWDIRTGEELAALSGHPETVYRLWFTADGERLYSSGADGTIRTWGIP